MRVDGNDIRPASIDAVTDIEYKIDSAYEGTSKIVRGHFEILLRGSRIKVHRGLRCRDEKEDRDEAMKIIRTQLEELRTTVTTMLYA